LQRESALDSWYTREESWSMKRSGDSRMPHDQYRERMTQ
jgi:hypothetical protein